ncbi:TonB-dependent receptor [Siphonobacter sp. SORGH_AS_1065]|uniref:TonB-dependent receptor n=1 Tax=Siphonobacter sp. SORGH_AS_1065 TaxID=3041795 RepID=UPI00278AC1BA|nr:TonB-dependent receptor [Siphonobacter sp. SORGH_AS_1065]MDQ1089538.1 outer membrane receptor for ferrienterochelin and colicins [Siphonobacter sp. SORGH_AS_1065]
MRIQRFVFTGALLLWTCYTSLAQTLNGRVVEKQSNGSLEPLVGVTVYWLGTSINTQTDGRGKFSIIKHSDQQKLVFSLVGYRSDTLQVNSLDSLTVTLVNANQLQEVTVTSAASSIDRINPIHTEIITSKSLAKAACCNLSESFETNASVSVSYGDAVTGAKQIQLLGLAGTYVQINTENIPNIRGLNTTFGLNYTPGTWISSIDVSKGVGSVVNGYEAMTGAINIELAKPDGDDKLFLNGYVNSFGRAELNLNLAKKLTDKWSVGLLSHGSTLQTRLDKNKDGFIDVPLYSQGNIINRWKYQSDRWMTQFGVKALYEDRLGGQMDAGRDRPNVYEFGNVTRRLEFFSKTAQLFPEKPYKGLALIFNGVYHDASARFGFKRYSGVEQTLYGNLIYQNIIGDTRHTYKLGASFMLDDFNEKFLDSAFVRKELVPGAYGEYTYTIPEKMTLVAGGRVDFHNLYGTRFTPRLHVLVHLPAEIDARVSAGKGWRVPNPVAENYGMLVNSRNWTMLDSRINPEQSWNYGLSLTKALPWGGKNSSFTLDFYRTDFQNQLVVDMESADRIVVYNLRGKSYANSFQAEWNVQPLPRTEIKLAYRWFDVQQTVRTPGGDQTLLPKMFVNRDRVLFNIGWASDRFEKWKFDFTWQWNGRRRVPNSEAGHIHDVTSPPVYAPAFSNLNAQVTKNFRTWALYVGGENLANFTQKNPIIGANDPFGKNFDASMVWGPVIGRMIYAGFRYKIQ